MKHGGVIHYPAEIMPAGTAEQVLGIVSHVIVPYHVVNGYGPVAVKDVEYILIGQDKFSLVLADAAENILRCHDLPCGVQIDKHDAGVEIFVFGVQTHLIDLVGHFGQPGVCGSREDISAQIEFP